MPLPIILGAAAVISGATGIGTGIHGAVKMKEANDTMKLAKSRHEKNIKKLDEADERANISMDSLGQLELSILKEFERFSDTIEKIQNRPQFKEYVKDGVKLPKYDRTQLKKVSVGAGVLLGGLGGAAVGTAGGFAAAGATTSAVMALGTASTGTAIATLTGITATNATLAALGGGAIAAGGGGMALGTTILGATTLGVGLLVGGVAFGLTGGKLSNKADEAKAEMEKAEITINKACAYLNELQVLSEKYQESLKSVYKEYKQTFDFVFYVVNKQAKEDWNDFSEAEKLATQNAVLLVGLLYKMCQVSLVIKSNNDEEINTINNTEVQQSMRNAEAVLGDMSV